MIDLVLFAGRVLLVILLYVFLFAVVPSGMLMSRRAFARCADFMRISWDLW